MKRATGTRRGSSPDHRCLGLEAEVDAKTDQDADLGILRAHGKTRLAFPLLPNPASQVGSERQAAICRQCADVQGTGRVALSRRYALRVKLRRP